MTPDDERDHAEEAANTRLLAPRPAPPAMGAPTEMQLDELDRLLDSLEALHAFLGLLADRRSPSRIRLLGARLAALLAVSKP